MDVYVLYDIIPKDFLQDGQSPDDILGVYKTKEEALEEAGKEIHMEPGDEMETTTIDEDGNLLVSLMYDLDDGKVHKEPFYYIVKKQLM